MNDDFELDSFDDDKVETPSSDDEHTLESEHQSGTSHRGESDSVSSLVDKLKEKIHHISEHDTHEPSFGSSIYNDAEIDKMKHDVAMAESEVAARKSDVSNWESKVSLNNTEEHKKNGDYANAVSHLNDAKSRYNNAVDRLNAAKSKLNNAL
jgi:hypothetical protein